MLLRIHPPDTQQGSSDGLERPVRPRGKLDAHGVAGADVAALHHDTHHPRLADEAAVLDRDARGELVRKAGVMAVVLAGGDVRPGDPVRVEPPPEPHTPLAPV